MTSSSSSKFARSIQGIVTVNDKGQIVIPAEARLAINLKSGDKLLVMTHPSRNGLVLIKPDGLEKFAKQILVQLNEAKDTFI